ncbi:response regulator transcription factor [Sphingobacterium faecium]|jgi:DNA-binding NarL/FixJ family response regulator|uniref:response regulator transcription factor n=2 Tax=Sphingobacteriaceae TaxID=84566 RepID=UPI001439AD0A|nr:response regulator transcription factor [Sphingobacterium sp. B16(2022)]NJI72691.1 response regulator transcription factor [Sphingobacterium sp. B16(2022)]
MINIILADDHDVVLTGMKLLIESQQDMTVVGEGKDGHAVLEILETKNLPDLLITDLKMPGMDGLELVARVKDLYPSLKIIILSMEDDISNIMKAFNLGANGYLTKNVDFDELFFCIRQIMKGLQYVCAEMTLSILSNLQKYPATYQESKQIITESGLTEREIEILHLIGEGYSNIEIADKLFLSKRTVEGHRQRLLEKTALKNTASLIKYAVNSGLIA